MVGLLGSRGGGRRGGSTAQSPIHSCEMTNPCSFSGEAILKL